MTVFDRGKKVLFKYTKKKIMKLGWLLIQAILEEAIKKNQSHRTSEAYEDYSND